MSGKDGEGAGAAERGAAAQPPRAEERDRRPSPAEAGMASAALRTPAPQRSAGRKTVRRPDRESDKT
ncbi:MAG: hypothetical protein WD341_17190 [Tistlia sp.]|uniref:hypothetical protein n=1 Tax=Tistlia sp. TaxID=3057121 RepID=UPI0034A16256